MSAVKVRKELKAHFYLSYEDDCHVMCQNEPPPAHCNVSFLISCVFSAYIAYSPLSCQENMYLVYVGHTNV